MRVNSINPTINYSKNYKYTYRNILKNEPNDSLSFQGLKGRFKGGAVCAAASIGLFAMFGDIAFFLCPSLVTLGAYIGDIVENKSIKK